MKLGANVTMQVDAIPTGSLGLDLALGIGGVPRGRIVEGYGPESSGKTTLALQILAEAQKMGGEVAFLMLSAAVGKVRKRSTREPRVIPARTGTMSPGSPVSSDRMTRFPMCPARAPRADGPPTRKR